LNLLDFDHVTGYCTRLPNISHPRTSNTSSRQPTTKSTTNVIFPDANEQQSKQVEVSMKIELQSKNQHGNSLITSISSTSTQTPAISLGR
ncbi:hypothetical protein DFH28DRAFT_854742, partial [Melampsora americana]